MELKELQVGPQGIKEQVLDLWSLKFESKIERKMECKCPERNICEDLERKTHFCILNKFLEEEKGFNLLGASCKGGLKLNTKGELEPER